MSDGATVSTIGAFAASAAILVGFVVWERRSSHPMLDMALFRNPAFSTAAGGMLLVFLAMYGVMFLITMYFQFVLGYTPLSTAIRFLPITPAHDLHRPPDPEALGPHRDQSNGRPRSRTGVGGLIGFRGLGPRHAATGTSSPPWRSSSSASRWPARR